MIIGLAVLAVLLICGAAFAGYMVFFDRNEPTPDPSIVYTQVAHTVVAQLTQDAGATAVAQLTQIAQAVRTLETLPTDTPAPTFSTPTSGVPTLVFPATATPWILPTPTPTFVYLPTATTAPATPCDQAAFVKDVTIPDNSVIPANTRFTKVWRVRNDGACTWDASYALVFNSGAPMTNNLTILVPRVVLPGQTVDLGVEMVAPGSPGQYQSNWLMRNSRGTLFGFGPSRTDTIFARIRVPSSPNPNPGYAFDFVANYCNAQWRTENGLIGCAGPTNSQNGSVISLSDPPLETRTENEPGLWVRPNQSANGFIAGYYPTYLVKSGDHFVTELSCMSGSNACDVTFRLDYLLPNGSSGNLGAWREVYDNHTTIVDINLASLTGQSVQFILRMQNNGNVSQANGIWFLPSIRNTPVPPTSLPPTVTPTATRTQAPPPPTVTYTPTPTLTVVPYPYPRP